MKILNSKTHGLIDYVVVVFLLASPSVFGLPELTSMFTWILGLIHFLLTISTRFEYGVFPILTFRLHGYVELVVSIALVGVAFYLGSLEGSLSRIFYLCFAVAVFLTWLVTDYNKAYLLKSA